MSVREVQTSAARILHVDRLDDGAARELKSRFRYHPLDIEALFSVPVEPSFSTYGEYGFVTLLWPDARTGDISELRFFIDRRQLTIIGDTPGRLLRALVEELHQQLDGPQAQYSAPELFHEALQRLRRPWNDSVRPQTIVSAARLASNAQVIRQLGRCLTTLDLSAAVPQLIIDAHALDGLAARPVYTAAVTATAKRPAPAIPSLLRAYTVASAVMVLIVIVTLAIK